jgi:RNA polymerase sigma-70 factor (ECF subfamily)
MGMRDEFLAAYDAHADGIFRFALAKTSDKTLADDIVQETFLRAWDSIVRGARVRLWKPYVFQIAYRLIVDSYRKRGMESLDQLSEEGFEAVDEHADISQSVEMSRVRRVIAELPDHYRDVILLRFVEGLSPKDIARVTDLSHNVVSVRIHRGIRELRARLDPT